MKLDLLAALNAERKARRPAIVMTDLASGSAQLILPADLVKPPLMGTELGEAMATALRLGKSTMVTVASSQHFLAVHVPPLKVLVIGAVHISQAMVPMARTLGLDIVVIDPRSAFATPERFPDVALLAEWPDDALTRLTVDRYTAMVALTHDPKIDDPALVHAMKARCFYIGALGSRKTHAARIARLQAAGFDKDDTDRVHAPIGLDIGAVSPAEIALAILGEIVSALRKAPST